MKINFNDKKQSLIGIIIVLVTVGLITGGLYFYFSKQISEIPEITEKPAEEKVAEPEEEIVPSPEEGLPEEGLPEEEIVPPEETIPDEEIIPICQNECSQNGLKRCSNNGYQICGNYDADNCLEWGSALPCYPNEVCKSGHCVVPKGSKLLLLVENSLYNGLSQELSTYSNNVERELGFETIIKTFSSSASISEIKSYIKQSYNNYKLTGVLLIGDLPTGRFFYYTLSHPENKTDVLSDRIYQDVHNNCEYSTDYCWPVKGGEECGAFDWLSCGETEEFFISRLTPNSSTKDSLSLLKDYFKRNHQYRTGEYSYKHKFLVYAPFYLDESSQRRKESIEIIKTDELEFLDMYDENTYKIIDIEKGNSDQLYLNEVKKAYEYEGVFLSAHGSPSGHQKSIKSEDVINTGFFSGSLHSCSTGKFTEKDYIAGKYLFEGKSLFISAPQLPAVERVNLGLVYYSLANGEPLYKALKPYRNLNKIAVLGDLTLRMRYVEKPLYHKSNNPVIAVNQTNLHITPNPPKPEGFSLKVKNLGKSSLKFSFAYKNYVSPKGYRGGSSFGVKNTDDEIIHRTAWGMNEYVLNPGSEATINYYFYEMSTGNYKSVLYLLSNDPVNPVLVIPVEKP